MWVDWIFIGKVFWVLGGCQIYGDFWNLREILVFEKFGVQILFELENLFLLAWIPRKIKKSRIKPGNPPATWIMFNKKNNQEEQILDISIPDLHVFLLVNRKLKNVCSFNSKKYRNSHLQKLQLFVPFSHLIFLLY